MFRLPRGVWLLGWVSLATDAASEAIYPLIPFFLTQVLRASAVSLGIVEGAAEAANSLLKIVSGWLADRSSTKRPLVLAGYSVSSAIRPFIAVTQTWPQVFAVRVADRVGKGVRGAPRDAMLAGFADRGTRGRVFGFHRAMDHVGAIIGPTAATLFLMLYPGQYRTLFALTIVPGVIAVLLILLVPEASAVPTPRDDVAPANPSLGHGARTAGVAPPDAARPVAGRRQAGLPGRLYLFLGVMALFTLGNSSDTFLLLRLTDAAGSVRYIPLIWAALHVVKASVSFVGGSWSDRVGRRRVIAIGWLVYAIVYDGFAVSSSLTALIVWFLIYGLYFGFTEGTEKALVADLAPVDRRGTAFGIFTAVQGVGALAASILFGEIWTTYGPAAAFGVGSAFALAATALLFLVL